MRVLGFAVLLAACAQVMPALAQSVVMVPDSSVVWRSSDGRFGGLSGLEITDNGTGIVAISDRGNWVRGTLTRDKDGTLTRARVTEIAPILGVKGNELKEKERDAEGLTFDADGRAYVSFEGYHRVRRFDEFGGKAHAVPGHAPIKDLNWNLGIESLAMDADGTIYAIPERARRIKPTVEVYRYRNGEWDSDLRISRGESFLQVDATFGPDGRFYTLERKFKWLGGFATRVRSFRLGPEGFYDEVTLLKTRFGEMDNMEGISVWTDPQGRNRVTLISDDNFFPLQQTVLAEYVLKYNEVAQK